VFSLFAYENVGVLPEFKLRMPVTDSASYCGDVETTLCGYATRNSEGFSWSGGSRPARFYRLVYRRGKNGSGGTLPPALDGPHDYDVIAVDAEQEERRLLATEESRQRYGMRMLPTDYYN